jgi:hypothetical protein
MTVSEAMRGATGSNTAGRDNDDASSASRPKLRYAFIRPALDACAAFGLFVLMTLALSSGPSSASPHHFLSAPVAISQPASPALAEAGDGKIFEVTSKTSGVATSAAYRQTDMTSAWLLLSLAFSVLAAFNMALIRHLRQAYASPRNRT